MSAKRSRRCLKAFEKIDSFVKEAIRMKVHGFFRRRELPTVDRVLQAVNDDDQLPNFKRTTFFKILKDLNFKYQKRSRKSILLENEELQCWRRNYLRKIAQFRQQGRKIFYTDETWVNTGHTTAKVWKDMTIKSIRNAYIRGLTTGLPNPKGRGERIIILHIGNE